jgi:Ca-activated chloride channel homolog
MSADRDLVAHVPEAPPPSPQARDAAVDRALELFDEKYSAHPKGFLRDARHTGRAAMGPSHRRPAMRMRYLIAACLACFVVTTSATIYFRSPSQPTYEQASVSVRDRTGPVAAARPELQSQRPELLSQPKIVEQPSAPPPPAPPPLAATAPPPVAAPAPSTSLALAPPPVAAPAPPPQSRGAAGLSEASRGRNDVGDLRTSGPASKQVTRQFAPVTAQPMPGIAAVPTRPLGYASPDVSAAPPASGRREQFAAGQYAPTLAPAEQGAPAEPTGRDQFTGAAENPFKVVRETPVSTFSLDVDTASYSFARASLNRNVLPQPASVRTEEFINYFPYAYEAPASANEPFRTTVSVFPSPWSEGRKLIRIGIKGYAVQPASRPRANLVFLVDTSGSMNAPNRLPLVKQSLALLVSQLQPEDRVAIVTYAGNAGTALEPTAASDKGKILGVIENLEARGSTAGGEGIRQAYALAERNFDPNGVNRVMLATDGDFNVGITSRDELKGYIERQRGKGIFLSVLGFGMGNYNDALMQALAQNGNGVAAYVDTINEARKVMVEEATSTLIPIAKDVKIQVEFNPATVAEYRLVGYETRLLNRDDFNNDKVDAGDVGSGQTVTALYEIVPVGGPRATADLRYAPQAPADNAAQASEYGFLKMRYKLPKSDVSTLVSTPIDRSTEQARFQDAPVEARFAVSVAAFGEILRGGRHTGTFSYDDVVRVATAARGDDPYGYRAEFINLVRAAKTASALQPLRR